MRRTPEPFDSDTPSLPADPAELQARLARAEETLRAIQMGTVDALVLNQTGVPSVLSFPDTSDAYRVFVDTMAEGAVTVDADGLVLFANRQAAQMMGLPLARLVGQRIQRFLPSESDLATLLSPAGAAGEQVGLCRADGTVLQTLVSSRPASGMEISAHCLVLADLTEVIRGQEAATRLAALVDGTDEAVVGLDAYQHIESVNRGAEQLFGFLAADILGHLAESALGPQIAQLVATALHEGVATSADTIDRRQSPGASYISVTVSPVISPDGEVSGASLIAHDVSTRQRAEAMLRHQIVHDDLTGLMNRVGLLRHLTQAMATTSELTGLLFIDVDRFKRINDSLGHGGGDEVLRSLASRTTRLLRPGDTAARIGGDEFVIVCRHLGDDHDGAMQVLRPLADQVLATFREPVTDGAGRTVLTPSASIGVAIGQAGQDAEELLHDADAAMYRAKRDGRARTVVYDAALRRFTVQRDTVINHARKVIEDERLQLALQPIVSLRTGQPVSVEALLRWNHPAGGLAGPVELLDVSEDAGMSLAIGDWVIERALETLAIISRDQGYTGSISVNLSPAQVGRGTLHDQLRGLMAPLGMSPDRVCLEVTEDVSIDRSDARRELADLAHGGFPLALDDFGTGYASLTHLQRLPLTSVKIDRSFVAEMDLTLTRPPIISSLVDMARDVGLLVVAEGIETAAQEALLTALGCDHGQGFRFGHPMTRVPDLMRRSP